MLILIAEDDTVSRLILKKALEGLGHQCVPAVDGADAWEKYEKAPTEAVISDWLMPGIDGLELCRRIRAFQASGYTYFIMLSTLADRKHYLTGMQAGADDYLTKPLDMDELKVRLVSASRVTSLHRRLNEQKQELEQLNHKLFEEGRRDPLTGVGNRLRLQDHLAELLPRVERYDQSYCVALCDIDHFKRYNDTYGHLLGDEALRRVARTLVDTLRTSDSVYRYGGEEFLVLLPEQSLDSATLALRRVTREIENLAVPHVANSPAGVLTVSSGVAELKAGNTDVDLVLRQADAALYRAKEAGRNQVVAFTTGLAGSV